MKIKVITIDFWNTLFDSVDDTGILRNSARYKVLINTVNDLGISLDLDKLDEVMQKSWKYYNQIWLNEMRTPKVEEILKYIWENMNFKKNDKAFDYLVNFFENSILYFPPQLQPNVLSSLEILHKKYLLAIISDTGFSPGRIMSKMMQECGILKYFTAFSYSDETGVSKPHPLAFNCILEKVNCKPENAIHIGDIERTDIEGAKSVGMYAIRYDGDKDSMFVPQKSTDSKADFIAKDWNEITNFILTQTTE